MVSTIMKNRVSNSNLLDDQGGKQRRRERGAERGGTIGPQCHNKISNLFDIRCRSYAYRMEAKMLSVYQLVLRKCGEERKY